MAWTKSKQLMEAVGPRRVLMAGAFRANAAATPTVVYGTGFQVARSALGTFDVTLDELPNSRISIMASVRNYTTYANSRISVGEYNATTGVFQLFTRGVNQAIGTIPCPLSAWRVLAVGVYQNLAAHGGILAVDSTPILTVTATVPSLTWGAGVQNAVHFETAIPADLDTAQDVTFHMVGTNAEVAPNATPITTSWAGGAAVADDVAAHAAARSEQIATIAHGDLAAPPGALSVVVTPAAHAAQPLVIESMWFEYKIANQYTDALVDMAADADNEISFIVMDEGAAP
jgi:hypothetical protein